MTETCAEARRVIAVFRGRMTTLAFASLVTMLRKRSHRQLQHATFAWRANHHESVTTREADEASRAYSLSCARAKIETKDIRTRLQSVLQRTLCTALRVQVCH